MSKSEIQVLDFEKICRLCLLEKRSMSAIFSKKKSDKKVPLPVRIMSCASLELYEGDGLPASICNKCLMSVNQSYAFREQCEQADTTLRQYAQRLNEANEEASTCVGSSTLHFLAEEEVCRSEGKSETETLNTIKKEEDEKIDDEDLNCMKEETYECEVSIIDDPESNKAESLAPPGPEEFFECETQDDDNNENNFKTLDNPQNLSFSSENGKTVDDKQKKEPRKRGPKSNNSDMDANVDPKSKYRPCAQCSKIVLKKNYSLHLRVHSVAMPHMCDICGRCFKWRRVMEGHKRTHTGEKPYLCNTCGKSFTSSSRLSDHSSVHTGKKSYVCELCATAFRDKKHLVRHFRTHTGEKPFKCSFCGRGFSNSWNLKEHTRRHTGELPHVCSICQQGFNRNKGLEEHMKTKHEKQTVVAYVMNPANNPEGEEIEVKPDIKDCEARSKVEDVHWVRHIVMHHPETSVKTEMLDCPLCSSKCPTKNLLMLHIKHAHKMS